MNQDKKILIKMKIFTPKSMIGITSSTGNWLLFCLAQCRLNNLLNNNNNKRAVYYCYFKNSVKKLIQINFYDGKTIYFLFKYI